MGMGVAWFSLASLLLPAALSPAVAATGLTFAAVLAARFLVGVGEGVAMPAMNNLVARFVPPALKATALGNCYTGFHTGGSGAGAGQGQGQGRQPWCPMPGVARCRGGSDEGEPASWHVAA